MSLLIERIKWLVRRKILQNKIVGFQSGLLSYCSEDVELSEYVRLYGTTTIINARIGKCTYFSNSKVGSVDIGAFCSIGPGTRVGGLGRHPTDRISTHPVFYSPKRQAGISFFNDKSFDEILLSSIGHDVWIGANAVILDGVKVGNGAIIAAGSVVNKNVPPFAIVGGVPARIIRYRFSENQISILEDIKWWDLPLDFISSLAPKINSRDVYYLRDEIIKFKERGNDTV